MKKIIISFLFLIIYSLSFSYSYPDYDIFIKGKEEYYSRNFKEAQQQFETLLRIFPKSTVLENNYGYFFIGMNYYNLQQYKKASFYLEKATYSPKNFFGKNNDPVDKILFFSERDFALGNSLIKIGEIKKGITYLKRLNFTNFIPNSAKNEALSLLILSEYNDFYKEKFELKFKYNFNMIKYMPTSEILNIGKFYTNKGDYNLAAKYYQYILDNNFKINKKEIYKEYFKNLINLKEYNKILELTQNSSQDYKGIFNFYRGIAFYEKKDFVRALYNFQNIKDINYLDEANFYTASIYYILKDYYSAIKYAEKIQNKSMLVEIILGFSYLETNDMNKFKITVKNLEKKSPSNYVILYFSTILKNEKTKFSTDNLKTLGKLVDNILKNSKNLPKDFMKKSNELEIKELSDISNFGDKELLKINFDKSNLLDNNSLITSYATTKILEHGKFYSLAFQNSKRNLTNFIKYRELTPYEFPLYFNEIIKYSAKKYDIPEELIYTVLHELSGFNIYYMSNDLKFGLMGISYLTNKNYSLSEIFNPEINIDIGAKLLKKYIELYNGNKFLALIHYIYGENYAKNLNISNGNINFDSIIMPIDKFKIKNTIFTYLFYLKLYN